MGGLRLRHLSPCSRTYTLAKPGSEKIVLGITIRRPDCRNQPLLPLSLRTGSLDRHRRSAPFWPVLGQTGGARGGERTCRRPPQLFPVPLPAAHLLLQLLRREGPVRLLLQFQH